MNKRQKKRRAKLRRAATSEGKGGPPGSRYFYGSFQNPLEHASDVDIDRLIAGLAEHHSASFSASFGDLRKLVERMEPLTVLSSYSAYHLTTSTGESMEWTTENPILQHHVELLQAIFLMQEPRDDARVANPQDLTSLDGLLRRTNESFIMQRIGELGDADTERKARLTLVEELRGQTQAVRNWGYQPQIRRIVSAVFEPLDETIEGARGVRVDPLFEMHRGIEAITERKLTEHLTHLRPVAKAKNLEDAVGAYARAIGASQEIADEIAEGLRKDKVALELARWMLISHADLRLMDCFVFGLQDFVDAYPGDVSVEALRSLLDDWSFTWGDLASNDPEHLFLGNPIWKKPIVQIGEGQYFWPILGLFYSFAWDLMESLLPADAMERYSDARSSFLESEVERLFRTALPNANFSRGSYWDDPQTGKRFENDLLVQLDTGLIVVEAKSGKITDPAKRGAELRIKSEVEELLVDPSQQAQRFARHLLDERKVHRFETRAGENEIDTRKCLWAIPMSVTLDSLTVMAASNALLETTGFVPEGEQLNLAFSCADLETVLDLLPSSAQRIHYLRRRNDLERRMQFMGDELDLLAMYVDTGFDLGAAEEEPSYVMIPGLSGDIHRHFIGKQTGIQAPKPERRMSDLWMTLLETVEQRSFAGWLEVSMLLLYAPYGTQKKVQSLLRRTARTVRTKGLPPQVITGGVGPKYERKGLVLLVYQDLGVGERNAAGGRALEEALREDDVDEALLLGFDVAVGTEQYSFLSMGPEEKFASVIQPSDA